MSNLVINPGHVSYYKSKACLAISRRYNYAGSFRSCCFHSLCFRTWNLSYRAAFCYVLKRLEDAAYKDESHILVCSDLCSLFVVDGSWTDFYDFMHEFMSPYFDYYYCDSFSPVQKLSFVYKLLECLIRYNLGDYIFESLYPLFEFKSAIRYSAFKYFPDTPFIEIESDFMFKDVMD